MAIVHEQLIRFNAAGVFDPTAGTAWGGRGGRGGARGMVGVGGAEALAPGAILIRRRSGETACEVLAIGSPAELNAHEARHRWMTVDLPTSVVMPGFVNAHTHLDLTHIGPQPHDPNDGFVPWVDMIRARRMLDDPAIEAVVRLGVELSRRAGVVAIGDIAGAPAGRMTLAPFRAMAAAGMAGASAIEFFGIGLSEERAIERLIELGRSLDSAGNCSGDTRVALQPHAPNTVARRVYRAALQLAARYTPPLHLMTHLAETREEREFIASGTGPQRDLLERFNLWTPAILDDLGHGLHPVQHLRPILAEGRFTVAHVNDADDLAIQALAETGTNVVYCPRASAYFAADRHFGPHRYRDMLSAGVNVAIGTDSIVNLPSNASWLGDRGGVQGHGMSILDELRFLYQRDRTDPEVLLRMGTINGATALGLQGGLSLRPGQRVLGLIAIDVGDVLHGGPVKTLNIPKLVMQSLGLPIVL